MIVMGLFCVVDLGYTAGEYRYLYSAFVAYVDTFGTGVPHFLPP